MNLFCSKCFLVCHVCLSLKFIDTGTHFNKKIFPPLLLTLINFRCIVYTIITSPIFIIISSFLFYFFVLIFFVFLFFCTSHKNTNQREKKNCDTIAHMQTKTKFHKYLFISFFLAQWHNARMMRYSLRKFADSQNEKKNQKKTKKGKTPPYSLMPPRNISHGSTFLFV